MKMIKIKSSLFCGFATLVMLFPHWKMGSLTEIAQPYLGVYECVEARWNETELLGRFEYLHLELKKDGEFVLHYQEKSGERKEERGKYEYDNEKEILTMIGGGGGCFKREFPLKEGVLLITLQMGDQMLSLKFEQK